MSTNNHEQQMIAAIGELSQSFNFVSLPTDNNELKRIYAIAAQFDTEELTRVSQRIDDTKVASNTPYQAAGFASLVILNLNAIAHSRNEQTPDINNNMRLNNIKWFMTQAKTAGLWPTIKL